MRSLGISLVLLLFSFSLHAENISPPADSGIVWQAWSEGLFAQAKKDRKLVILDLEAVWCHWCHVMDQKTYSQAPVIDWIRRRYLPVRVDQDSRPDLANRYRDYGWPATIVFNADGKELAKRSGFIPPEEFTALLERLADHPETAIDAEDTGKIQYTTQGILAEALRQKLQDKHGSAFDPELGGLKLSHKFVDADSLEYSLRLAKQGDEAEKQRAQQTLQAAMALLDPEWGGVYQYSHGGDWRHPHFEKVLSFQRDNLRSYSLAYAQWGNSEYLRMAQGIERYLQNFLRSPEGGFYTSQDADVVPGEHSAEYFALDDAGRRNLGMPRIDRHRYARENGWVIEGLVQLYLASGEQDALALATQAADWTLRNRALAKTPFTSARWLATRATFPEGGFSHDAQDADGPYLGDTLAMGRACLALYTATADRRWLQRAESAARFISDNFRARSVSGAVPGFVTALSQGNLNPVATIDENISAVRFFNLLSYYSGRSEYKAWAESAMRYLATPEVALQRLTDAGILLADEELRTEPTHVTVIGRKTDAAAGELFRAALRYSSSYLRVEWWDRSEGPMPNPDVQYPELPRSAAFICSHRLCSSPVFAADKLMERVERLSSRK